MRRPTQLRGPKPKGRNTNGLLGLKPLRSPLAFLDRSQRSGALAEFLFEDLSKLSSKFLTFIAHNIVDVRPVLTDQISF
uniref:Uncharacterized protein n=1 Tax=Glossina austeni TaxID=7395 RepID=A0A1A9V042_GLOAU